MLMRIYFYTFIYILSIKPSVYEYQASPRVPQMYQFVCKYSSQYYQAIYFALLMASSFIDFKGGWEISHGKDFKNVRGMHY